MHEKQQNPIDLIAKVHIQHAALCDTLEEIADSLPDSIDTSKCTSVLDTLNYELPLHHKDEELGLFPLLQEKVKTDPNIDSHLQQLSWEHAADESAAHEIADVLDQLSHGERAKNPEMLGYMLRSFFESYRRHLHWENTVLLPLARQSFSSSDLEALNDVMANNRFSKLGSGVACNGNCTACKPKNVQDIE
ncbi:MAG: hemerythrin domain-containing protein [Hyphomicrobiales bacterium]